MLKAKYLNAEQAYALVTECYQSGLTTRQWLAENGMNPSTFYRWVRKFRASAPGNDLPARNESHANPAIPYKQDVVQVDVIPDESGQASMRQPKECKKLELASDPHIPCASIAIQFAGASILISDHADPRTLTAALRSLKEALC